MKRVGIITALSMLLVALTASVAFAAVAPGTYGVNAGSFNGANAPGSSHLTSGTPTCTVNANLSIDCSAYVLGGVGHTNADVLLTANYTAIIDCFNGGTNPQNPVESHTTSFSPTSKATVTSSKNGQLSVPTQSVSFTGAPVGCPNPNWTPVIRAGSVTLVSFSYTLTFNGFTAAYITISRP
jgi:hypothetical protein